MALQQRGIKAENLSSRMASSALENAENSRYDILYMTPEKACLLPDRYVKISYCLPNTINSLNLFILLTIFLLLYLHSHSQTFPMSYLILVDVCKLFSRTFLKQLSLPNKFLQPSYFFFRPHGWYCEMVDNYTFIVHVVTW